MQTFLVSADFIKSATYLDNKRLIKQSLESRQILNTLCGWSDGWKAHPCVNQWKNYISALICYGLAINTEIVRRGFKDNSTEFNKYLDFVKQNNLKEESPSWIHNEAITSSHRSRLICKGEIDVLCDAIKKHFKFKKIDVWCKAQFGLTKNQLRYNHVPILSRICVGQNLKIKENHYNKFGWTDDPSKDYVWPK